MPPALDRVVTPAWRRTRTNGGRAPTTRERAALDRGGRLAGGSARDAAGAPLRGRSRLSRRLAAAGALAASPFSRSRGQRATAARRPGHARCRSARRPRIPFDELGLRYRRMDAASPSSRSRAIRQSRSGSAPRRDGGPRALPGRKARTFPFWSPDGRSLGFFVDRRLMRSTSTGGSVRTLCTMDDDPRGGAWSPKGVVLFSPGRKGGLQRVSSEGGTPVAASKLDASRGEVTHRWPQFLPGGERFFYWASGNDDKLYLKDSVRLSSLGSDGAGKVVLEGVTNAVWSAGHLVSSRRTRRARRAGSSPSGSTRDAKRSPAAPFPSRRR